MAMTASRIQAGFEPIPGYILREKLGVGGYGEVWLADAPGGLKKAIKFVHGNIDEDKATNELKSLQRIRQVNHPFILSLERIEVVEGQLMIVTELANGSLHDRLVEFREKGFVGIPKDRLLGYLSDAADGLDFLCQQHDLQHLDVKPANLLLIADRVKVADFGLIKDIQSNSLSVMGGLTPTYAAPEMFDGRPGRFSDQYSLAIVYQELLTSTLPFRGRTTAQLANEHLHKAPNLEAIPLLERPILSKALSKKPQMRFSDCRELIRAIERVQSGGAETNNDAIEARSRSTTNQRPNQKIPQKNLSAEKFKVKPNRVSPNRAISEQSSGPKTDNVLSIPKVSRNVEVLPALEPTELQSDRYASDSDVRAEDEGQVRERKALVVGLGGTGAEVLLAMRRKIYETDKDRLCKEQLGFMLIDTDQSSIERAGNRDHAACLPFHALVHIPLKSPQYYRQNATYQFPQLSRRWVYNIPRSLKTDGVRPLGMLAFLDHAAAVFEAIHHTIAEIAQSNGTERCEEPIHVQLIASAHGGTGGAIACEIGFLLRQQAAEFDIPVEIELVLTCASPHGNSSSDLLAASALSCLTEINHYFETEGLHPPLEQIPPSQAVNQPPFDHVTLVHGGQCGSSKDWENVINEVSEYLYSCNETEFGTRLSSTRHKSYEDFCASNSRDWTSWLSTVNIRTFEINSDVEPVVAASRLCLRGVLPWIATLNSIIKTRHELDASEENVLDPKLVEQMDLFVGDMFRTHRWTAQAWVHNCMLCVASNQQLQQVEIANEAKSDTSTAEITEPTSIASPLGGDELHELEVVCDQLAIDAESAILLVSKLVNETRATLADWLLRRWLSTPTTWSLLKHVLRLVASKFSVHSNSLATVAKKLVDKHDSYLEQLYNGTVQTSAELEQRLQAMSLEARFHSMASKMLARMAEHVATMEDLILNECEFFQRDMNRWAAELAQTLGFRLDNSTQSQSALAALTRISANDSLTKQIRKSLQSVASCRLESVFGTSPTPQCKEGEQFASSFASVLEMATQRFADSKPTAKSIPEEIVVGGTLTSLASELSQVMSTSDSSGPQYGTATMSISESLNSAKPVRLSLAEEIDAARPYFVEFGGAIRNTLVVSSINVEQIDSAQKLDIEDKKTAMIVSDRCKNSSIICLGERMVLSDIMDRVWMPSNDIWQLSNRILTRVDVDWLPVDP